MNDNIHIGVEDIEPNHWVAWVFAIPGCYASARAREQAIRDVPAAIRAETGVPPIEKIIVAEEWRAVPAPGDPEFLINACFADDHRPLMQVDIEDGIRRLQENRQALLNLTETDDACRNGDVQQILAHMATAETWYLIATGWPVDDDALPSEPIPRLATIRCHLEEALIGLEGSAQVVSTSGEDWTARKLLRRAIWHERDHTGQLATMLAP